MKKPIYVVMETGGRLSSPNKTYTLHGAFLDEGKAKICSDLLNQRSEKVEDIDTQLYDLGYYADMDEDHWCKFSVVLFI